MYFHGRSKSPVARDPVTGAGSSFTVDEIEPEVIEIL
jgi:hypothetical protein